MFRCPNCGTEVPHKPYHTPYGATTCPTCGAVVLTLSNEAAGVYRTRGCYYWVWRPINRPPGIEWSKAPPDKLDEMKAEGWRLPPVSSEAHLPQWWEKPLEAPECMVLTSPDDYDRRWMTRDEDFWYEIKNLRNPRPKYYWDTMYILHPKFEKYLSYYLSWAPPFKYRLYLHYKIPDLYLQIEPTHLRRNVSVYYDKSSISTRIINVELKEGDQSITYWERIGLVLEDPTYRHFLADLWEYVWKRTRPR